MIERRIGKFRAHAPRDADFIVFEPNKAEFGEYFQREYRLFRVVSFPEGERRLYAALAAQIFRADRGVQSARNARDVSSAAISS